MALFIQIGIFTYVYLDFVHAMDIWKVNIFLLKLGRMICSMWLLDKCTFKGKSLATLTLTKPKNGGNVI